MLELFPVSARIERGEVVGIGVVTRWVTSRKA